jgi:TonB family protein
MANSPKNAFGFLVFALAVFTAGSVCVRAQTHLGAEEADKLLIESPTPRYPPIAEKSKIQGTVKLNVAVSKTGSVVSVRTISGHMFLAGPAVEAVKKRRYRPYELNGKPAAFTTVVEVRFSAGIPDDEYERELETARQFFDEEEKCRDLLKEQKYSEAEVSCKATVKIADRLPAHRGLEKSGAYAFVGQAMLGLRRFQDALEYFTQSYEIGKTVLKCHRTHKLSYTARIATAAITIPTLTAFRLICGHGCPQGRYRDCRDHGIYRLTFCEMNDAPIFGESFS